MFNELCELIGEFKGVYGKKKAPEFTDLIDGFILLLGNETHASMQRIRFSDKVKMVGQMSGVLNTFFDKSKLGMKDKDIMDHAQDDDFTKFVKEEEEATKRFHK